MNMQQLPRPESFFQKDKPKIMYYYVQLMPEQRSPALEPDEVILILCYFQLMAVCKWASVFNMKRKFESGLFF